MIHIVASFLFIFFLKSGWVMLSNVIITFNNQSWKSLILSKTLSLVWFWPVVFSVATFCKITRWGENSPRKQCMQGKHNPCPWQTIILNSLCQRKWPICTLSSPFSHHGSSRPDSCALCMLTQPHFDLWPLFDLRSTLGSTALTRRFWRCTTWRRRRVGSIFVKCPII